MCANREVCVNTVNAKPPKRHFLKYFFGEVHMKKENKRNKICNNDFTCIACGRLVRFAGAGSGHRNHCPNCLCSLHLDISPGDRNADCGGVMEPIAVWVRKNGEWAIIHRCSRCGWLSSNRIAADDNPLKLMSIALKPVSSPPFPLERIEEMTRQSSGDGIIRR